MSSVIVRTAKTDQPIPAPGTEVLEDVVFGGADYFYEDEGKLYVTGPVGDDESATLGTFAPSAWTFARLLPGDDT